ncbi:TipAS antibiotic-recognition domain-containing protein [Yaniella flava]|uniref:TipAS antibiotic-recognition domain-containing protein n=1 Tax=Yaniella flava TaxID=287930 RepID=A0ABP5FVW8_9MICC|nr:MerR family transcriptional regulator [Micrococcaceae bacterium]
MEWSIHQVVEATGITSRTLRYYDQIDLLVPSRTGHGDIRYYDQARLIRLQRILLLRDFGMPLTDIADVLEGQASDVDALRSHRARLLVEKQRIDTQMRSVETTIAALEDGRPIMSKNMFEGFDHTKYDAEVRERWGDDAADRSNAWWSGLSTEGQQEFRQQVEELNSAWDRVIAADVSPESDQAQEIAAKHVNWLGATFENEGPSKEQVKGIVQMYVDDERFAANYNRVSPAGPQFVRDAVHYWADHNLHD